MLLGRSIVATASRPSPRPSSRSTCRCEPRRSTRTAPAIRRRSARSSTFGYDAADRRTRWPTRSPRPGSRPSMDRRPASTQMLSARRRRRRSATHVLANPALIGPDRSSSRSSPRPASTATSRAASRARASARDTQPRAPRSCDIARRAARRRASSQPASTGTSSPGADASESRPEAGGHRRRDDRLVLHDAGGAGAVAADRRRRLDLPGGIRAEEPLHRPDRGEHLEPRGGALDRLRHPRPRDLHPVRAPAAIGAAGRRAGADADDAADDHHLDPRRR